MCAATYTQSTSCFLTNYPVVTLMVQLTCVFLAATFSTLCTAAYVRLLPVDCVFVVRAAEAISCSPTHHLDVFVASTPFSVHCVRLPGFV